MITALISAAVGLVSGILPDMLKEVRDSRDHGRELEMMKLQHKLAVERMDKGLEEKIRAAEAEMQTADINAFRDMQTAMLNASMVKTGIGWIDGFNAIIRPATAMLLMVLFCWSAIVFIDGVLTLSEAGKLPDDSSIATMIWGSMLGEAFMAVFGFLFGYRSTIKAPKY